MSMTPSQPYLLRAIYDWIVDNEMTPYVLVNAENDDTYIPRDYVENGKIVLNVSPVAVDGLDLGNDYVAFNARFAGKPMEVSFPVTAAVSTDWRKRLIILGMRSNRSLTASIFNII